jgi:hypothetical protein
MRKEIIKWVIVLCAVLPLTTLMIFSPSIILPQEKPPTIEVYFSPHRGCIDAIIRELNTSKSTVFVYAHSAKTHLHIHNLGNLSKKNFQINIWKTFNLEKGGRDG